MAITDRLRSMFARKDSRARAAISIQRLGQPVYTPANYERLARQGYQKNVVAYRCISSIAGMGSSVPWVLYKKGTGRRSKGRQEIENSPLHTLFDRPNPLQSGMAFHEAALGFLLLSGNSYINAVGPKADAAPDPSAQPKELWNLRPDRMKVVPSERGVPAKYVFEDGGRKVEFVVDLFAFKTPVLHMKTFHPTDYWYGMAAIEAGMGSVDAHNASGDYNLALFQNMATPSGALMVGTSEGNPTGTLDAETFERVKGEIQQGHSGARNAGKPLLLEGGLDWKAFGYSPEAMMIIENRFASAREVALAFNYPSMLLNIPGENTYANLKEAKEALWTGAIFPKLDLYKAELQHWLVPAYGEGLELDYDRDAIDDLAYKREVVWTRVQSADWLTVDEKREATGYEAMPNGIGRVLLVQGTLLPLEQAVAEPEPTPDVDPNADPDADPAGDEDEEDPDPAEEEDEEDGNPGKHRQGKVFGRRNDAGRIREWRTVVKLRAGLERRFARHVSAAFKAERDRVLDAVQGLDPRAAEHAAMDEIDDGRKAWARILSSNSSSVGTMFGERVLRSLKSLPNSAETKDDDDDADVRFRDLVNDWVERNTAAKVTSILDTSRATVRKKIKTALEENLDEGDGLADLQKAIKEAYDGFTSSRAMTIARTETMAASNAGSESAARASGVSGLQKEWISAEDERTRKDHTEANGQKVGLDDEFTIGGAKMGRPGEGPADQVINCRCTIGFVRGE